MPWSVVLIRGIPKHATLLKAAQSTPYVFALKHTRIQTMSPIKHKRIEQRIFVIGPVGGI